MPGEQFPCIGCHASKSVSPDPGVKSLAGEAKPLDTPLGIENQYFDYDKMIQPIWDAHCINCHKANHISGIDLRGDLVSASSVSDKGYQDSKRSWTRSYLSLTEKSVHFVGSSTGELNFVTIFSPPEQQPAYSFGSSQSRLITKVISTSHHDVKLTQKEKDIIACWIDLCVPHAGYYSNNMSAADSANYARLEARRIKWETIEAQNINDFKGYSAVIPDKRNPKFTHSSIEQIGIQCLSKQRVLVLNKPGQGNLKIVDLRGKVIFSVKLSKQYIGHSLSISLPASLTTGLYMVRFESVEGIEQRMISVIK
jgi:hypothetical protein